MLFVLTLHDLKRKIVTVAISTTAKYQTHILSKNKGKKNESKKQKQKQKEKKRETREKKKGNSRL
jgi:ribosomal protein L12E/L44/L45/RPP1/RPP2